ncbi:MAG: MAPEG family protein [Rhodobacter sp.]|nr:MAPEG family protein [Rhodobacter sp.]
MTKRGKILLGMAAGVGWGIALVWIGTVYVNLPIFTYTWTLALAFLFPGLFLAAVIGRIAQRRFFDDAIIDGEPLRVGSGAEIDARVLQNTIEQIVLALVLWPVTGYVLATDGPGVVMCLGIGFLIARVLFWVGYHISPPLRAFGFAATFYPSVIAVIWSGLWWVVR